MEGSFPASSFQPPAVGRSSARYAPWALLDSTAYFADRENDTTAEAVTSTGHAVRVTFCLADPPAISHFCVHGPWFNREDFYMEPQVHSSAKDLVLLSFAFTVGPRSTHHDSGLSEYFVYKAGRGKPPSLTPIPPTPTGINLFQICILPLDNENDDGGFLLAQLVVTKPRSDYDLHVFSSKTGEWTVRQLRLQTPPGLRKQDLPIPYLDNVMALGRGAVGWVDLWCGIVTCNVLDESPVLTFIPIPMHESNVNREEGDSRLVRDITCCDNGFIKFVELDLRFQKIEVHHNHKTRKAVTKDLDTLDVIYDSEILLYDDGDTANPVEHVVVPDGWKLRTCYRHTSWDYWRKGHAVDINEISADNPEHFTLLPELWDAGAGRSPLRNLYSGLPTLGIGNDDVVYLMSKVKHHDKNVWMIGVDLGKKTVDVVVPVSSARLGNLKYYHPNLLACEFSQHLNATLRKCAKGVGRTPNGAQRKYQLSSENITQNNLPPEQSICSSNGYYYNGCFYGYPQPSNDYGSYQHPPPWPANLPQPLYPDFTSCGPGYAYPMNAQSTYPGLYTGAGG